MAELSAAHVGSGFVMTVDGPRPSVEMGVTLMHEHLQNDCSCWWHPPETEERQYLVDGPVRIEILSELRQDPFVNRHNIALDELDLAIDELGDFVRLGGQTVVDPTCRGIGRDPNKLRQISARTGLQIVMGAGYYLASSMPEALTGVDGTDARIGLIGEIGVSGDFLEIEERSLRGAARAQARTGLPLMVHLPGWFRHAHKVLDIVESESADVRQTVLCHMNPSFDDVAYQTELADRGAFLEFDMIGMDFYYADQGVQCPSDDQVAEAIIGLAGAGHLDRLLLSQDVFIKMMLTRYGGNGYAFVLRHFLPRLERHGMPRADAMRMLTHNARSVFDSTIS